MFTRLTEELLILALDTRKGRVAWSASAALPFGLRGAILAELLLDDHIETDEENKVFVKATWPTKDDILEEALTQMRHSKKNRSLHHWLSTFIHSISNLEDRVFERLVIKGVLRRKESRFLGMFPLSTYPLQNPAVKEEMRLRLRTAALGGHGPEVRTLMLFGLADACNLTDGIFSAEERKQARKRLKGITADPGLGSIAFDVMYTVTASAAAEVIITTGAAAGSNQASSYYLPSQNLIKPKLI
jgi:Golgi phosphoprotein 3